MAAVRAFMFFQPSCYGFFPSTELSKMSWQIDIIKTQRELMVVAKCGEYVFDENTGSVRFWYSLPPVTCRLRGDPNFNAFRLAIRVNRKSTWPVKMKEGINGRKQWKDFFHPSANGNPQRKTFHFYVYSFMSTVWQIASSQSAYWEVCKMPLL